MKKTRFFAIHQRLGAKIVDFAGFAMPVQYPKGIIHEHLAVRQSVGLFDVSHMGEFEIRGTDAAAFLQYVTINDVTKLYEGRAQYSAMCKPDGGLIDDLLVYHLGDRYMMVVNAANIQKDYKWLQAHRPSFEVEIEDLSDATNLLAVQGPNSLKTLQKIASVDLEPVKYYHWVWGEVAGVEMIISRTGYTGELGFELYFRGDEAVAEKVWNAIMEAGEEFGIEPAGLGARDTLRLEKGYCLYGNDIDETTNPLEAGLGWITKLKKGDFIGREALLKVKEAGIQRRLVGFVTHSERYIPRHGYEIVANDDVVGSVTSGNISPIRKEGIGLGYVPVAYSAEGTELKVRRGKREFPVWIHPLPFV